MQAFPNAMMKIPIFSYSSRKMPCSKHYEKDLSAFNLLLDESVFSTSISNFEELSCAAKASNSVPTFANASDSVESDKNLLNMLEPTPFRAGANLQVSPESNKTFTVASVTDTEPLPLQAPYQPDKSLSMNAAMDNESQLSPSLKKSRKRSISPSCCSPTTKRTRQDPSVADQAISNTAIDLENSQFRPDQESRWDDQYAALLKFKGLHGHCNVPHTYKDDLSLSRWAKRQRYQYKLKLQNQPSAMTADRQQKLEVVGFVLDPQTNVWETRRKELVEYKKRFGNCDVPVRYEANRKLGTWVKRQRRQYRLFKLGKLPRLPNDRFMTLKQMGFQFEVRGSSSQRE